MRIGVSSSARWWVSAGPLFWLLTFWLVLPVMAAWYLLVALGWLCVLAYRAVRRPRLPAPLLLALAVFRLDLIPGHPLRKLSR